MIQVQQAEGITNDQSHEPSIESENLKHGKGIMQSKLVFKLSVLEIGVKALQRLREEEAMSMTVGFLCFAIFFYLQISLFL